MSFSRTTLKQSGNCFYLTFYITSLLIIPRQEAHPPASSSPILQHPTRSFEPSVFLLTLRLIVNGVNMQAVTSDLPLTPFLCKSNPRCTWSRSFSNHLNELFASMRSCESNTHWSTFDCLPFLSMPWSTIGPVTSSSSKVFTTDSSPAAAAASNALSCADALRIAVWLRRFLRNASGSTGREPTDVVNLAIARMFATSVLCIALVAIVFRKLSRTSLVRHRATAFVNTHLLSIVELDSTLVN
ncbi:hypothetical protein BD410DRAFT_466212 [Rickenella mellea]|uniref:Uncharacterized protein n=1 Tax=Rickenella mellea TaxID=50990 RepID=A0A4Y7PUQ6_9AGAM|nr:hypothetical protein BD410DRAFT_466212 [Rickenella mellea]